MATPQYRVLSVLENGVCLVDVGHNRALFMNSALPNLGVGNHSTLIMHGPCFAGKSHLLQTVSTQAHEDGVPLADFAAIEAIQAEMTGRLSGEY